MVCSVKKQSLVALVLKFRQKSYNRKKVDAVQRAFAVERREHIWDFPKKEKEYKYIVINIMAPFIECGKRRQF